MRGYDFRHLRGRSAPSRRRPCCPACGQPVVYVQMRAADGRLGGRMPCRPSWVYADGRRRLVVIDRDGYGHLVQAHAGVRGRVTHWADCPARSRRDDPAQLNIFPPQKGYGPEQTHGSA